MIADNIAPPMPPRKCPAVRPDRRSFSLRICDGCERQCEQARALREYHGAEARGWGLFLDALCRIISGGQLVEADSE